jgi:hypothetical protein
MTTISLGHEHDNILGRFGLAIRSDRRVMLNDVEAAESADLHHTFRPIAAVGWCRTSPSIARQRLGEYALSDFVTKRFNMSTETAETFAAVCGAQVRGPFYWRAEQFYHCLRHLIRRHDLGAFFGHFPRQGEHHMAIRPRGFDWNGNEEPIPAELARFRTAFTALPEPQRMLVSTVMWLYRGGTEDSLWLDGLPRDWNGIEAILKLKAAGLLPGWGELIARYPGW